MGVLPRTQNPDLAAYRLGLLKSSLLAKRTVEPGDVFVIGDDIFSLSHRKSKRRAIGTNEAWSEPASS
jgi:hypothetical protein